MNSLVEKIDHLVYCVHHLEEGINFFKDQYGMQAVVGGRHLNEGTKNAIISLANQCYIEILAVDEEHTKHTNDRWMGIDLLTNPKLTRWAIKSTNLEADKQALVHYNDQLGKIESGLRQRPDLSNLTWQLTKPLSYPEVEVVPFLVDWSGSDSYPTDGLPIQGSLLEVTVGCDNPDKISTCLDALNIEIPIIKSKKSYIKIVIDGPTGKFEL